MWFSARAVRVNENPSPCAASAAARIRLDCVRALVQMPVGVVVLDRAADAPASATRASQEPRFRDPARILFSRSTETGARSRSSVATCSTTSSSVTLPSNRPSVNAKPELVVASALNPSAAKTRAEPASHGFGITKASPACRA
jgi:hypothetical protein